MKLHARHARLLTVLTLLVGLFAFGQQCSRTPLEVARDTQFSLSNNPFQLKPPSDYPVIRRYVVLVDMSHSMISGPCPQDVDAGMLFKTLPRAGNYDPNKGIGDPSDHRADGSDCQVNAQLPITRSSITLTPPNFTAAPYAYYQTTLGSDYEGDRFAIVRQWIQQIKDTTPAATIKNTQILLYPFSGGSAQDKIIANYPVDLEFIPADDPKLGQALDYLQGLQWINLVLAQSELPYRYQQSSMGTSAPGSLLGPIHQVLNSDMYNLNLQGLLPFSEYRFIHLSDGMWTPFTRKLASGETFNQIDYALSPFPQCVGCTSGNTGSCTATCADLVETMKKTWGSPEEQDLDTMNFNYGKVQSLPRYYGNGFMNIDFVELKPDRHQRLFPNEPTFYEQLVPLFQTKNRTASTWTAESDKPPFDLGLSNGGTINFKITNVYLLNPNARVTASGEIKADSDGDGLTDEEEAQMGTNPTKARTGGVCLDSIAVNPAFAERCGSLSQSHLCDPTLDSDGDSLNECEEMILNTNPFGFDSDGDTIPDSLEWIYGYNPLLSDSNLDSNADGVPNLVNFANGMGGIVPIKSLNQSLVPNYALNYLGKGQFSNPVYGQVWLEQYQLMLHYMPTVRTNPVSPANQVPLYAARVSASPGAAAANNIPESEQLITYSSTPDTNRVLVLARMIDTTNPKRVYWRVYKAVIPVGAEISQPIIDLSQFRQIRAIDLNSGTGL